MQWQNDAVSALQIVTKTGEKVWDSIREKLGLTNGLHDTREELSENNIR